jgi:hypothetical protein
LTTTVSEESEAGSPCQSCRRDKSSCREGDVGGDGGERAGPPRPLSSTGSSTEPPALCEYLAVAFESRVRRWVDRRLCRMMSAD